MLKLFQWIFSWMLVMSLAACGGGGGSSGDSIFDGGGDGTTSTVKISLALSSTTVSSASPVTVTAKVTKGSSAVSGAVVKFSVEDGLGELSASSALTDSNGEASVTLSPADSTVGGADIVTASVTVSDTTATASQGFQLTATEVALVSVSPTSGNGSSAAKPVSAYGQTVLTVVLEGVTDSTPATVSLASSCTAASKGSISPSSTTTTSSTITFVYTDAGCGSLLEKDIVTATLSGSGKTVQGYVYLEAPASRSLAFDSDSLTEDQIYLKGSGLTEASSVAFLVNDQAGNPLAGKKVDLTLTTYVGGITLDGQGKGTTITKTTDSEGRVSVIVNAGTVPTPVRVKAVLHDDASTSAVSSVLSIGVGLPSQLNFSLSQETINLEGGQLDGTDNTYVIYAADRSGNPVPAGTAITFWAEGGQITTSRQTTLDGNGIASASAAFVTQSPRPADGRVTITAYAIGEESFFDSNGNNVYDKGEPFQDLGDVVKDTKHDGVYDASYDEFVSLDNSTSTCVTKFVSAYPQFATGASVRTIPTRKNTCDGVWSQRTYVRRSVETVLSTSEAGLLWGTASSVSQYFDASSNACSKPVSLRTGASASSAQSFFKIYGGDTYYTGGSASGAMSFIIADANEVRVNPMPKGTAVTVTNVSDGLTIEVLAGGVPNTAEAPKGALSYVFDDGVKSGRFTLTTTTPGGTVTKQVIVLKPTEPETTCQ
jgi:hypothetical protein